MTSSARLPLPPAVAQALKRSGTSRSLVFDRGFDQWDEQWKRREAKNGDEDGRLRFLSEFSKEFGTPSIFSPKGFEERMERRLRVLESLGARKVPVRTGARLVIGLGLSHPTETGLLLDRLTGCPYLPGTSVKGLMRSAAGSVTRGELEIAGEADSVSFWKKHRDRLFGPALTGEATPAKGHLVVHDAFPERWPHLTVDVLTPHYQPYYGGDEPPADWHQPVPVPFLTVREKTQFVFSLDVRNGESRERDLDRAESLLLAALRQIGLGGKTAAGYGVFEEEKRAVGGGPAPVVWHGVRVTQEADTGMIKAFSSTTDSTAFAKDEEARKLVASLPDEARQRFTGKRPGSKKRKKRKPIICDVEVVQKSEEWIRLVGLRYPAKDE